VITSTFLCGLAVPPLRRERLHVAPREERTDKAPSLFQLCRKGGSKEMQVWLPLTVLWNNIVSYWIGLAEICCHRYGEADCAADIPRCTERCPQMGRRKRQRKHSRDSLGSTWQAKNLCLRWVLRVFGAQEDKGKGRDKLEQEPQSKIFESTGISYSFPLFFFMNLFKSSSRCQCGDSGQGRECRMAEGMCALLGQLVGKRRVRSETC
jgi:hypothetical protein